MLARLRNFAANAEKNNVCLTMLCKVNVFCYSGGGRCFGGFYHVVYSTTLRWNLSIVGVHWDIKSWERWWRKHWLCGAIQPTSISRNLMNKMNKKRIFGWSLWPYTTLQISICSIDMAVLLRKRSLHATLKDLVEMCILMTPNIKCISHREEGIYCGLASTRLL